MSTVFPRGDRFVATGGFFLALLTSLGIFVGFHAARVRAVFAIGLGFDATTLAGHHRIGANKKRHGKARY